MAARKNKIHPDPEWVERTRNSIETGMLIKSLTEHVKGIREMTATQVSAGLGLLRKTMPDLAATEQKTEVNVNYVARIPQAQPALIEWQAEHDSLKPTVN